MSRLLSAIVESSFRQEARSVQGKSDFTSCRGVQHHQRGSVACILRAVPHIHTIEHHISKPPSPPPQCPLHSRIRSRYHRNDSYFLNPPGAHDRSCKSGSSSFGKIWVGGRQSEISAEYLDVDTGASTVCIPSEVCTRASTVCIPCEVCFSSVEVSRSTTVFNWSLETWELCRSSASRSR